MAFIGNTPTTQAFIPAVDFFSGNGSTTAFTLSRPVASVAQIQAVVENVPQMPGDAYTVSGNTITFTSAPASGTNNIYVYYTSPITQVIAPSQGTVFPTSMSTGGPSWDTSGTLSATTLRSNNYYDASGGSNAQLYGVASPPNSMGFRNRVINSAATIDQRNAGASVANIGNGAFIVDRFYYDRAGLGITAQFTASQSTDAPTGFRNSIKLDTTTAQTLGATGGTYIGISHKIEGFNMADLAGVACTLSFWVKATKTGTYSVVLKNSGADRSLVVEYTVSASNTWEQKTLSVAALPTAGTWNYTNGTGLQLFWCVAVADDVATSTIGSWISSNVFGSTSNVEGADSTANDFLITGVQLEAGTVASPFQRVEYGEMLRACQRYFQRGFAYQGIQGTGSEISGIVYYTPKRASPTLTNTIIAGGPSALSGFQQNINDTSNSSLQWWVATGSKGSPGYCEFTWTATAEL